MGARLNPSGGTRRDGPTRVAIVGLGPKGLFALERLFHHAAASGPAGRIDVDVFESHPVPGAGPVYDPAQPTFLRMNFAAEQVDMWSAPSAAVPDAQRLPFTAWSEAVGEGCAGEGYPARAEVGRYLECGLRTLLSHTPPNASVTVHRARVEAVRRQALGWQVLAGAQSRGTYDEVLLATGHDQCWDGALAQGWNGPAPLVPSVFPVATWCSPSRIPRAASVAVRGFALTFIDAALALTEGRGGSFEALEHAYRLRYVPGEEEVRLILPFSRTGRPMLAKPGSRPGGYAPTIEALGRTGRDSVARLRAPVGLHRELIPIIAATARAIMRAARGNATRLDGTFDRWLAQAAAGVPIPARHGPVEEIHASLAVGAGLRQPDLSWALGQTWRALYPALVARLSGAGLAVSDWPDFLRLAREMERLAFGPSPINAAKLLALIDAGIIDLSHVAGGRLVTRRGATTLCSVRGADPVDVVLDAVLPGPGAGGRNPVLMRLLREGHVRIAAGRRGLDVGVDGSCHGTDGAVTAGLAAIGRTTEDAVIGNDTLNRRLHPLADRWAMRVVAGSRRGGVGAVASQGCQA